jgi:RimJ/RimL family protein N-acetyltransferase
MHAMNGSSGRWKPGAPVVIETERFTLRSMTRLQAALATFQWTADPEVMHPLGYPAGNWTRFRWYKRLKRFDNKRKFFLAIYPRGTGEPIGHEGVNISVPGSAFLSVAIGNRDWWGRGVVHETRRAVIDFMFDEVGCHRVWGTPTARNFASIFNYQALGFTHEGVLRRYTFDRMTREHVDSLIFGLLREEWLARTKTSPREGSEPARPVLTGSEKTAGEVAAPGDLRRQHARAESA